MDSREHAITHVYHASRTISVTLKNQFFLIHKTDYGILTLFYRL